MTQPQIKQQTQAWLTSVIIHYNICPFARSVVEKKSVHYCVDAAVAIEENLQTLIDEAVRLDSDSEIETTLLIYATNFVNFDDFLDYLELANRLLALQGYEGIYQLASFHPNYCFEGTDDTDAANYTNRSPYPMLHLIREVSIEKALKNFPNSENIPQQNIKLTRELGLAKMQALLAACKTDKDIAS
jgi:hypothetical protein